MGRFVAQVREMGRGCHTAVSVVASYFEIIVHCCPVAKPGTVSAPPPNPTLLPGPLSPITLHMPAQLWLTCNSRPTWSSLERDPPSPMSPLFKTIASCPREMTLADMLAKACTHLHTYLTFVLFMFCFVICHRNTNEKCAISQWLLARKPRGVPQHVSG